MDRSARRFASWVLAIHLMVLGLLVVIVILASHQFYSSTRDQALYQVRIRQEILAAQAGRGIENLYRSTVEDGGTISSVPIKTIEKRFLDEINEPANIGAMLLDDRLTILS